MLENHPAVSGTKEVLNGKEQPASASEHNDGTAMPVRRKRRTPSAKRRVASAVTSGRKLFVLGNGNSPWSRRYTDLVRLHAQDVSGGLDLSQAQQSLIRRAAAIECELELMEGRLSLGQPVDLDMFTRSASHLRRILETLGVERRQVDVTPPSLAELADKIEREAHGDREVLTTSKQLPAGGTLSPQPDDNASEKGTPGVSTEPEVIGS